MNPQKEGTRLFHFHVNEHYMGGMVGLFEVLPPAPPIASKDGRTANSQISATYSEAVNFNRDRW